MGQPLFSEASGHGWGRHARAGHPFVRYLPKIDRSFRPVRALRLLTLIIHYR